jgi:hypothetical protein
MGHLAKDAPYKDTSIAYTKSMADISEMLREFGAVGIRWTELDDALPVLEFLIRTEIKGREMEFRVMVKPPSLPVRRKINNKIVNTENRNASMRLVYWYLKARLEAVKFDLESVFEAFMLRVVHSLPDGRESTIGESIKENPETFKLILPTFDVKAKALRVENIDEK